MFKLSIFISHEECTQISGTPHPDPPVVVEVVTLEGEVLICLRWWFDTKELFRVTVKSWIIYFTTPKIVRVTVFIFNSHFLDS